MTSPGFLPPGAGIFERPGARALLELLNRDGEEARVAGGAVRNALLGIPAEDIDIAATLAPDAVIKRCAAAGLKTIPTGFEFGTVTVLAGGGSYEVTTLREDVETDGRRAKVRFGRDFRADAARRDFTVNAMSAGLDGRVHDYFGGMDDLRAGRIRFIGEARQRIREDFLRTLRFFRFHAQYGRGPLDTDGLSAVTAERGGLGILSRERVRQEAMKLLIAPGRAEALQQFSDAGLMPWAFGCIAHLAELERLGDFRDPVLALAALCLRTREDALMLRDKLKLSGKEFERLDRLAAALEAGHGKPAPIEAAARRARYRLGTQTFSELCRIKALASEGESWEALGKASALWPQPVFPLTGADAMALGIPPGPRLGAILKATEERWIETNFPEDAAAVKAMLEAAAE